MGAISNGSGQFCITLAADHRAPQLARRAIDEVTVGLRPLQRFDSRVLVSDLVSHATINAVAHVDVVTIIATVDRGVHLEVATTRATAALPLPLMALLDTVASCSTVGPTSITADLEFRGTPRFEHLSTHALLGSVRSGDEAARGQLAARYLGLGVSIARSFGDRGVELEDLIAIAELGLVRASLKFDPDRGVEFSTFASHVVRGDLRQYFRDLAWAIGMPRSLRERARAVSLTRDRLGRQGRRSPTDREIADELNLDDDRVREATNANLGYRALTLEPKVGRLAVRLGYADPGLTQAADRVDLEHALQRLDAQDRFILHQHFIADRTQVEVARDLGMSQVMVSRRITASVARLRIELSADDASAQCNSARELAAV